MSDEGLVIPHQYTVRVYKHEKFILAPKDGNLVTFIDHRNPGDTQDLPNPKFLALHAAIAGITHVSGAAEVIDQMIQDAESVRYLAAEGSSSVTGLFIAHSTRKVCHVVILLTDNILLLILTCLATRCPLRLISNHVHHIHHRPPIAWIPLLRAEPREAAQIGPDELYFVAHLPIKR